MSGAQVTIGEVTSGRRATSSPPVRRSGRQWQRFVWGIVIVIVAAAILLGASNPALRASRAPGDFAPSASTTQPHPEPAPLGS
jgi:choline-glycine betaine transporter